MAHGSFSFVRSGGVPLVSSLAVAISDVGLNAVDHHLDGEHFPHVCSMALTYAWPSLGCASQLDYVR